MKYKQTIRPKKNKPATYEIPIYFHNLRGYDSHLFLEHFPPLTSQDRVNCIAKNFEQFFTFSYRGLSPGEAASSPHRGPRVNAQMMTSLPSPLPSPPYPLLIESVQPKLAPEGSASADQGIDIASVS